VKIPSLQLSQHFIDKIDWVLDLAVGTQLPSFNDNRHTNHIVCSRYVQLQGFMGFWDHQGGWCSQVLHDIFKSFICFFHLLELVLLFDELEEREPPDTES
jgi:hypothetical protein